MKLPSIIILFIVFLSLPCFALELTEGKMKIIIHEDSGSFSAYYLDDINSGKYIPLLFEKDSETSILSIMVDNKFYKMGNSSGFSRDIYSTPFGGKIVWESKVLKVTEDFSFLKSNESSLSDGFKITISVENVSDQNSLIGITYLFDTYMGEDQNTHFMTDSGTTIASEDSYLSQFPNFWISPSQNTNIMGLQGMVRGPGITVPDKIIFANWKRLQDNMWNFQVKKSRNFNLIPYSINDSAVLVIYDPIRVSSKSGRDIVIAMGGYNNSSFKATSEIESSEFDTIFEQTINTETDPQDTESSVRSDLIATTDLIHKIDALLQFPESVTDNEIDLIEQILETLKQRQKLYEDR